MENGSSYMWIKQTTGMWCIKTEFSDEIRETSAHSGACVWHVLNTEVDACVFIKSSCCDPESLCIQLYLPVAGARR